MVDVLVYPTTEVKGLAKPFYPLTALRCERKEFEVGERAQGIDDLTESFCEKVNQFIPVHGFLGEPLRLTLEAQPAPRIDLFASAFIFDEQYCGP